MPGNKNFKNFFSAKEDYKHIDNINQKSKFIFIHIPKNAGTSVFNSLEMQISYHYTCAEYKQILGNKYSKYFKFCFVRNPFERFISLYNYARMEESYYHSSIDPEKAKYGKHQDYDLLKKATLEEAVDLLLNNKLVHDNFWNHWKPQADWVEDEQGNFIADYIGRVEDIRVDFQNICRILHLGSAKALPFLNTSQANKKDYRNLINTATRQKLENYYKRDLDLFGYCFDTNYRFL